ncbi:mitochondrial tRNA-specific 2-thiouridylase 1 isoform X1 [Neodiprion fabricii]|uniref:mitochondrial tRNA-specific 2-thiouridylase 1 isoform X1 n=1 Tax=Neodiprion fabricii TaxID=2872261 RepID=UPI001ED96550|nr:mitochondrial tRNA-specific 2-thiouridylase 1 isoform X1 [Neodiprion fabricii]
MRSGIRRVVVGMSGGVDSAVSALLLKRKGFDVVGVFMQNWDANEEIGTCTIEQDYKDAERVCDRLGVPLTRIDFVKEYWNEVFSNLLKDYESGYTPNPDIRCNKFIKFRSFFDYSTNKLGADAVATGHYANTSFGTYLQRYVSNKNVKLLQAKDAIKDQTFFLCQIPQDSLRLTMFPLGEYYKKDVVKIARENGLYNVANKRESTGICFIGKRRFQDFISEYVDKKPGNFIDLDTGTVVGKHNGIHHWTLGQGCRIGGVRRPYFVFRKDSKSNDILVVQGTNHPALYTELALTSRVHWIDPGMEDLVKRQGILNCNFRFQHTHPLVPCKILQTLDNRLIIRINKPLRAVTPGQFAALYLANECLGGAQMLNVGPSLYSLNQSNRKDIQEEQDDSEECQNSLKRPIQEARHNSVLH